MSNFVNRRFSNSFQGNMLLHENRGFFLKSISTETRTNVG